MAGWDMNILGAPADDRSDLANTNEAIDGIMKLAQRVMVLLLTDSTVSTNIGIGTTLPTIIFSANNQEASVFKNEVDQALDSVLDLLKRSQKTDDPDDEKIDRLTSKVLIDTADEATIDVGIVAQSGDETTVSFPVTNINTSET
jgi:hypothetical protein